MGNTRKKFVIIDGNALAHRAWHALPPLKTKDGRIVNAAFGFTSILLRVMKDLKPDYMAVTFDLKGPTFRHEKFAEYKAQRVAQADEFYTQFPIIKDIVRAFNIPVYEKSGFEADDLIGTLCKHPDVDNDKILSVIVTGDQDTLQLIDNNTEVFTLRKGMSDTVTYDTDGVKEKFGGLTPDQMIDYKALRGDPSDNIPGVKGIGEKTAIELLAEFGTLEKLYEELEKQSNKSEKIKERIRGLLIDQKKQCLMSKDLSTIRTDVPMKFDLQDCVVKKFDQDEVYRLFADLEFQSLLSRLPSGTSGTSETSETSGTSGTSRTSGTSGSGKLNLIDKKYLLVDTDEKFENFLVKLKQQKIFVFDTETTGLNPREARLLGVSFSWKTGEAYYVTVTSERLAVLKEIFEDAAIKKVGQNMKFDAMILKMNGIDLANYYFDTMIASYLLNPGTRQHGLDYLAFTLFQYKKIPTTDLIGTGKKQITMAEVPVERVSEYSCEDADFTWRIYEVLEKELAEHKLRKLFDEIEMPLIPVLIEMEFNGIKIDVDHLKEVSKKVTRKIKTLEDKIHELAEEDFNINSPLQLKKILFEKLLISTEGLKKTKTGISTAGPELDKLVGQHEIIDLISQYRELSKLKSTYLDALPRLIDSNTGRLHTSYNQTITATGRLSSSEPNLQNIPVRTELGREIRRAIVAPRGFRIVAADYSQVELRVIACLAKDEVMMDVFKRGEDIHRATAAKIFGVEPKDVTDDMRRKAKEVNFGVLYGMGAGGLAQRTGISRAEAKEFIQKYFDSYKRVKAYTEEMVETAHEKEYVETLFGRQRSLPEINSNMPMLRAAAERMAVNMPIQGTAADLMKIAMIEVYKEVKKISPATKMLMQVHDELVFEVPVDEVDKVAKLIDEKMEKIHKLAVPIKVDTEVGMNWDEMTKVY